MNIPARNTFARKLILLLVLPAAACAPAPIAELPEPEIVLAPTALANQSAAATSTASPTLAPYAELGIESLAARDYGGGVLQSLKLISEHEGFNRYLMSYPSDGLTISGFVDIPNGEGSFPVVLVLHGYVEPAQYLIETYTARYAASFAEAGFIAIHPNYRNHSPSDSGPNLFRTGYAIDVLNLIAIVHEQAGLPGVLHSAAGENVFLWGHSMGGGITQRVISVGADVNGAVLYGSMSGDERQNFEHIRDVLSEGQRGFSELEVSEDVLRAISPFYYYERISVPVSIHHGNIDEVVPPEWSDDLCARLQELGKEVECFSYRNMPHTFYGLNDDEFMQRTIDFYLRNMH